MIEARTYRFYGHSLGDEQQYRTAEEVEAWKTDHDPIKTLREFMADRQWLSDQEDAAIQDEVKDEIASAVQFAEESPYPKAAEVTTDVLAPAQEVSR